MTVQNRSLNRANNPSPKVCTACGQRAACYDTRQHAEHIRRRYRCACGKRWTTYEVTLEEECE